MTQASSAPTGVSPRVTCASVSTASASAFCNALPERVELTDIRRSLGVVVGVVVVVGGSFGVAS